MLEIATHPILVKQLESPLRDVLQLALEAHRYALTLDQDNPDTLFNTSQVLTAIAELYAKDSKLPDQDALQLLEEALELQNRCLIIQQLKLEESIQQENEATAQFASEKAANKETSALAAEASDQNHVLSPSGTEDQWFSIVEPVTKDTLIDTILAELGTLTTLCSILPSATTSVPTPSLVWIEEFSSKLIKTKLPYFLQDAEVERVQEVALARANFSATLLEAGFRLESIDANTYKRERDEAFQVPELGLGQHFAALMANANSLLAFNAALADAELSDAYASLRWNALSAAIANMTTASKVSGPVPDDIAETHFVRGNCSLLQHRLAQPPISYHLAVGNAAQLLKNADVFYRNAGKLYQDEEQKAISQLRAVVAQSLQADRDLVSNAFDNDQGRGTDWVKTQVEDMVDDGLIQLLS